MPHLQDFPEYIIREPGSVYARDYAVTNHGVMNSRARVLHSAKRPPPVPLQPGRHPTRKARCFGDGLTQKAGPKIGQLSQSEPVPLQNVTDQCRPVPL